MSEEKTLPAFADGNEHQICDCMVVVSFKEDEEDAIDVKSLLSALLDMAPLTTDCILID